MRKSGSLALLLGLAAAGPALAAGAEAAGSNTGTILGLYLSGLMLLLMEFFLIPGFGLPGMLGCCLVAGNLYLVFATYGLGTAWTVLGVEGAAGVALAGVAMKVLPHTALGKAMTLNTKLQGKAPVSPTLDPDLWVGRNGKAVDTLSPQGSVRIDDKDLDAKARRGLIPAGAAIHVVAVDGRTLVVELAPEAN